MDLINLQHHEHLGISVDFNGDGVDYFDHSLTIKDTHLQSKSEHVYSLETNELDDLRDGLKKMLDIVDSYLNY